MKRTTLLILTFLLSTALLASAQTTDSEQTLVYTASPHPAVILYDGRLPDAYSKNVENLESIRPFFANVEAFLCKIEGLKNVQLIVNIASKLTPSIFFDNSSIAETGLVTISINRSLFSTANFTARQLEVTLALIIATYSPARKGDNGIDSSPIGLARSMPTNWIVELILGAAATTFGATAIILPATGITSKKRFIVPLLGLSALCSGSIFFADRVRRSTIVHVPQMIFKHARSMLSETTRKDLSKNPEHYFQALAILIQVASYSLRESSYIPDIFGRAFYKFSDLTQGEIIAPENKA